MSLMTRRRFLRISLGSLGASACAGGALQAGPITLPSPGPRDLCPVCGMVVARYPAWVATVIFANGDADHFDGAKDLFKYLLELDRYRPGRRRSEITAIAVTEYYGLERIRAESAWYVIGSDVRGPMGHELVPLANEEDAREFARDHGGVRVLRFDAVTLVGLADLDAGRFSLGE